MTQDQLKKGISLAERLDVLRNDLAKIKDAMNVPYLNFQIGVNGTGAQWHHIEFEDQDTLNEVLSVLKKHLEAQIDILQREFSEL